jgi:hypothetical protein
MGRLEHFSSFGGEPDLLRSAPVRLPLGSKNGYIWQSAWGPVIENRRVAIADQER